MSSEGEKARNERAAFQRFAERTGTSQDWLSIESRKPKEPDLLCLHRETGAVAFELVRICDPNIAQILAAGNEANQIGFFTGDPSERIIRNKLKKTYVTPHPMELLIYSEDVVITPDNVIITTILPWFDAMSHSFRRAWFMSEMAVRCIWSTDLPTVNTSATR